ALDVHVRDVALDRAQRQPPAGQRLRRNDDLRQQVAFVAVEDGELVRQLEDLRAGDLASEIGRGLGIQALHRNGGGALETDFAEGDLHVLERFGYGGG